jgi:hypothetical protein
VKRKVALGVQATQKPVKMLQVRVVIQEIGFFRMAVDKMLVCLIDRNSDCVELRLIEWLEMVPFLSSM